MPQAKLVIDTANSVPDFYGVSPYGVSRNAFQSGNLYGGVQPTEMSADWCNAVQQEILTLAENYSAGPVGLATADPSEMARAIDYSHINRAPIYTSSATFTFASQTPTTAALTGGSQAYDNLVRTRTMTRSNISAGASSDVVSMSLPDNCQALLKMSVSIVQTDALATNYCSAIKYVSARNVAGTATVQDIQTPYFFTAGIAYTVTAATSVSSVICRITCPAVPAGKKHNAFGHIELISCHNAL